MFISTFDFSVLAIERANQQWQFIKKEKCAKCKRLIMNAESYEMNSKTIGHIESCRVLKLQIKI